MSYVDARIDTTFVIFVQKFKKLKNKIQNSIF